MRRDGQALRDRGDRGVHVHGEQALELGIGRRGRDETRARPPTTGSRNSRSSRSSGVACAAAYASYAPRVSASCAKTDGMMSSPVPASNSSWRGRWWATVSAGIGERAEAPQADRVGLAEHRDHRVVRERLGEPAAREAHAGLPGDEVRDLVRDQRIGHLAQRRAARAQVAAVHAHERAPSVRASRCSASQALMPVHASAGVAPTTRSPSASTCITP